MVETLRLPIDGRLTGVHADVPETRIATVATEESAADGAALSAGYERMMRVALGAWDRS